MRRVREDAELLKYLPYILGIIIIGGAVLIATGVVKIDLLKGACLTCGGDSFTVNSITPVNSAGQPTLISNDADIAGTRFMLDVTVNGGGQTITGTVVQSDFKQLTGLDVKLPLTITMNNVKETLSYTLNNQGTLWQYEMAIVNRESWWTGATCKGQAGVDYWKCIPFSDGGTAGLGYPWVLYIYKRPGGQWALINPPSISWTGDLTMSVGGIPQTKPIGSTSSAGQGSIEGSVSFGSLGSARWYGSLITGAALPNNAAYVAYQVGTTPWRVSSISYKSTYDTYINNYGNTVDNLVSKYNACVKSKITGDPCAADRTAITSSVTAGQQYYATLTSQNDVVSSLSGTAKSYEQTTSGTQITELAVGRYTNPKLQIFVAASSIGVNIPTGKPQIVKPIAPITFASGDNSGVVTFKVKNVGTGAGSFRFTLTDSAGEFYTDPVESVQISVPAGGESSVLMKVYHRTAAAKTATVTIKAYDYNVPNNYDTSPLDVSMTPPKACTPGVIRIGDELKTVIKCNSDGMGETIILQCQTSTVTKVGEEFKCATADGGSTNGTTGGSTDDSKVLNADKLNWYDTTPAKVLAGLIVVLIILLVWRKQNE